MFGKTSILLVLASLVAFSSFGGASHTTMSQTAAYDTPTTWGLSVTCTGCGGMNVGGAELPATGYVPIGITINDASGTEASFTACQDLSGDGACLDGEPTIDGCGSAVLPETFVAETPVTVFIHALSPFCAAGVATSGTIVVDYLVPDA